MRKRALIGGLGIAGMSAAAGLRRAGWTPVIVERAPGRRTGGALSDPLRVPTTPAGPSNTSALVITTVAWPVIVPRIDCTNTSRPWCTPP